MKTIGLIGGLTWYSSIDYYRTLNELVNKKLGGSHSARVILNSIDFSEIKLLTEQQDWDGISRILCNAARSLEAAGAECLMIGANTMHKAADEVRASVNIPLIHVADAVAAAIKNKNIKTVALLGTKYTMQLDFYKDKLAQLGIRTVIPAEDDIVFINNSIYSEFSKGIFLLPTKLQYISIINSLISSGAEGIIFGCTEIPILIKQDDCSVPVFDTAVIHSMAAVDFALE